MVVRSGGYALSKLIMCALATRDDFKGGRFMLLKELGKSTGIIVSDLITTPVGAVCYLVDGLKSGYSSNHIAKMLLYRSQSKSVEPFTDKSFLEYLEQNYQSITSVKDVYLLC